MKKYLLMLFGIIRMCFAQDIITLQTGEEIKSKVIEVGIMEIKYKRQDNPDSTIFFVDKSEVKSIKYKSGRVDSFNAPKATADVITLKTGEEIKAKVLEVGVTEIRYKKTDNPDTSVVVLNKTDIQSIKYKSGRVDVINEPKSSTDVIFLRTGEEIKAKILVVGVNEIQYKKADSPDTSVFIMNKPDIQKIKYKSGRIDIFDDQPLKTANKNNSKNMYQQGIKDAQIHYPLKNTGAAGVVAATLGCGMLGVIPAAICAGTTPNDNNLGVTDKNLVNNEAYMTGYRETAHKMKRAKIWKTFGATVVVEVGLLLIVVLSASH